MGGCISGLKQQNKVAPLEPKEAWMPNEEDINNVVLIQEVRDYILGKKATMMVNASTQTEWSSVDLQGNGSDSEDEEGSGSVPSLIRRMEQEIASGDADY